MSETKPVAWIADDRKPNAFFFRSPFRSWKFLVNTGLTTLVSLAFAWILWNYWERSNHKSEHWMPLLVLLLFNVVYPFLWAIRRHRSIYDLYRAGYLQEQAAGSPLDEVLQVADDAMNEGLRNSTFVFGLFLLGLELWKLR